MCGITGFFSTGGTINAQDYYSAHLTISHRGPDDEGFYFIDENSKTNFGYGKDTRENTYSLDDISNCDRLSLVLGHRRLSIIDLSADGHQPLKIDRKIICYNGEIYNYLELRDELISLGVSFNTSTDTEVFLAAYDYWGTQAFSKFNGMWAAAIYDEESKELFLVRDRFGIKPIYYLKSNDGFYFSSEIKFLKELGLLGECNENAIFHYLRHCEMDFDETTFFKNVFQLQPGEFFKISKSGTEKGAYWKDEDFLEVDRPSETLSFLLNDAIRLRLRSDVPVGSLLSGGIDSSLIVGLIREIRGLENFQSYSAVFENENYSEKKYIDGNARFLDFSPNYIFPKSSDLVENIETLLHVQEMPFRSLSVLSQYKIYQKVAQGGNVKVLLNGQGADEIFTGYTEHYSFYFMALFLSLKWKKLCKEFMAFSRNKQIPLANSLFLTFKNLVPNLHLPSKKNKFFTRAFKQTNVKSRYKNLTKLKKRLHRNLTFSALREYLRYEDRNSMYFSLEARLPFLDYRIVKFAFALEDTDLIQNGFTKIPLREECEGRVTPSIIWRKDKTGFVSPQEEWQRTTLAGELDKAFSDIEKNGLFSFIDEKNVTKFYTDYKAKKHNDWAQVWRFYCLYKWKKIWLDGNNVKN